jgi:hypothetical protein
MLQEPVLRLQMSMAAPTFRFPTNMTLYETN